MNLPDIPKLNECAQKLNTETEQIGDHTEKKVEEIEGNKIHSHNSLCDVQKNSEESK